MAYCETEELYQDIPEKEVINLVNDETRPFNEIDLTDKDDPAGERVQNILQDASDEVDLYLRGLFTVPLSTVPTMIKKMVRGIAIYNLYKRRFPSETPHYEDYKMILRQLEGIQEGSVDPGIPEAETNSSDNTFLTNDKSQIFTEGTFNKW